MSLHNLFVSFAEIDYSKPQTIWESKLEAPVATRPVIVVNPVTRDSEIMVQDEASTLYLINSSGRILWKMNPGEMIRSGITQIDLVRKGRLDYLFSTDHAIHLIDRNGAYIPGYPVRLSFQAANGLSLVDFDKNRDFRIFIAGTDNAVYAFDKTGKPARGWKPYRTGGTVVQPVQHFKILNKDYLVFADPLKVHVLDRKGAVRITPSEDFPVCQNSPLSLETRASGSGSRFLTTDIDGNVKAIAIDGTVESRKLGDFGPDHLFSAEDINHDGLAEFLFADHLRLEIFSNGGDRVANRKFESDITSMLVLASGSSSKIGLTLGSARQIVLLNADGSVCKGFPLGGYSAFTLVSLEKEIGFQNLLVGNEGSHLFNYAIK
jgi:hypothetical protein